MSIETGSAQTSFTTVTEDFDFASASGRGFDVAFPIFLTVFIHLLRCFTVDKRVQRLQPLKAGFLGSKT